MEDKVSIVSKRITIADEILQEINALTLIPKAPRPQGVISIDYTRRYDPAKVETIINELSQWQMVTTELLIQLFGEQSRFRKSFEDTIIKPKIGRDYKVELRKEVNSGKAVLSGIIESLPVIENAIMNESERVVTKKPLVFISHSTKDIQFIEALVSMLEGIGLDETNLFCSSIPGYWIGLGKDIFKVLRDKFVQHDLFVIFVQSPRFYESPVSLNEMGAAWALHSEHCSILTSDMEFSAMTAVVNSHEIAIKVNTSEAKPRLTELKNSILQFLGLNDISAVKWERIRDRFLCDVCPDYASDITSAESTSEEYQRLMIQKMKQEEVDLKKAAIKGNCYPASQKGVRIIRIFNAGKSTARNVSVEWLNPDDGVHLLSPFQIIDDLTPQNKREFRAILMMSHPETMRLRYTWEDDYNNNNTFEESLQL